MTSPHSIYKEFDNQMKAMISAYVNNNLSHHRGTICNISLDEKFVDVNICGGTLKAVHRIRSKTNINSNCIIIFMSGSYDNTVALCNGYERIDPPHNLLNNGRFRRKTSDGFEDWTVEKSRIKIAGKIKVLQ